MTITTLGSLTVGAAVPGMDVSIAAGTSGINTVLPDLSAQLDVLLSLIPAPPSDFTAQLALAATLTANLNINLAAGVAAPDVTANLAAAIAALTASVNALNAQLSILTGFTAPLAAAGIGAYAYDGALGSFGSELGAAIGPGATHANALALVTTDPAAWTALSVVLKVTP